MRTAEEQFQPHSGMVVDKVKHYKWTIQDKTGHLRMIPKTLLNVDSAYQRQANTRRATEIASKWSWIACGAIRVGQRQDGSLWVIDGQHRLLAALRRSDIDELPCVVFAIDGVSDEASGFVKGNTLRASVSAFDKHKANLLANDEAALAIEAVVASVGMKLVPNPYYANELRCVEKLGSILNQGTDGLREVLELVHEICKPEQVPPSARIVGIVQHLRKNLPNGLNDSRLRNRLIEIGPKRMERLAAQAIEIHQKSGDRVWSLGVLQEVNKGLRNKYIMKGEAT